MSERPKLLRRGGFRTLLIGQAISALGDWMGTFAFMALVYRQSGSATAVGGILALRLVPAALGGPLAARAASRWDRRRTMVAMDLMRAAMIGLVPLIRGLWWVYLWAFLIEVGSLVFLPARDASIPDLVDEEELPVANGLILGSSYGTIPLGAAVFALIAALPGSDIAGRSLALVFWLDALSFLVSAAMINRLTMLAHGVGRRSDQSIDVHDQAKVRFRDAFHIPLVRAVLPATIAVAVGLGALFSLGIDFVRKVLHASDAQFGVLVALFGVGAAGGLLLLRRFQNLPQLRATQIGVAALGVIVAFFSLAPAIGLAFLGAVLFGAGAAWTLASGMGALQSELDGQERILAFAVFHIVIRSGLAAAAIGAGAAGEFVGKVKWPIVGTLEPSRLVLLCSGILVFLSATRVRVSVADRDTRRVGPAERPQPEGA
jgi:predicted MFS family arabinose efflux permease